MTSSDAGATWSSLLGASAVRQTEGGPRGRLVALRNQLATLGGPNYLATQIALDPASTGCSVSGSWSPGAPVSSDDRRRGHVVPDDARWGSR